MTKKFAAVLAALLLLAGCFKTPDAQEPGSQPPVSESSQSEPSSSSAAESASSSPMSSVEEELPDVEITVPASLAQQVPDIDIDEAELTRRGVKDFVRNEDGSITFTISREDHQKLLEEARQEIVKYFDGLKNEDSLSFITGVEYNQNLTEITYLVKGGEYNALSKFSISLAALPPYLYQVLEGNAGGAIAISVVDADSREVLDEISFPPSGS